MTRFLPGLAVLSRYDRSWLRYDLVAGVSVAAVAVPIAIAYSQLAGVPPAHGLYASILPLVAYALLGSSRQLIMAPDAATCAIVAATVAPLAAQDPGRYVSLTMTLAMITGVFCIVAGMAGLGFLTNFLARPILTGYLNGIALSIISGQLGRLFGFSLEPAGFFRLIAAFISSVGRTHVLTLALGVGTFVLLRILKRVAPKVPGPLVAVAVGIGASSLFRFGDHGVALLGAIPAGLPALTVPDAGHERPGPAGARGRGAGAHQLQQRDGDRTQLRGEEPLRDRLEPGIHCPRRRRHRRRAAARLRRQRGGLADRSQRFGGRQEPGDRAGGSRPAGPGATVPHRSAGAPAHHRAGRRADQRRPRALRSAEPFQAPSGQSARVPLVGGHAAGRDHCWRAAGSPGRGRTGAAAVAGQGLAPSRCRAGACAEHRRFPRHHHPSRCRDHPGPRDLPLRRVAGLLQRRLLQEQDQGRRRRVACGGALRSAGCRDHTPYRHDGRRQPRGSQPRAGGARHRAGHRLGQRHRSGSCSIEPD